MKTATIELALHLLRENASAVRTVRKGETVIQVAAFTTSTPEMFGITTTCGVIVVKGNTVTIAESASYHRAHLEAEEITFNEFEALYFA